MYNRQRVQHLSPSNRNAHMTQVAAKSSLQDGDIQVFTTLADLMRERKEEVATPATLIDVMLHHNMEPEQMKEVMSRLKDSGFFVQS